MYEYLLVKYKHPPFVIKTKWTYRRGPKANLAVLGEPLRTSLWVEIQETRLSNGEWKRKLKRVSKFSDKISVVLTQNTIRDYEKVRRIISELGIRYEFLFFDTQMQKLYEILPSGEKIEIRLKDGKIQRVQVAERINKYMK